MVSVSHWHRLLDYVQRMGVPHLVRPSTESPLEEYSLLFHDHELPHEYQVFTDTYGFSTLFIDEDLCLGFIHPHQSKEHPLYYCGVYPFVVCSSDCQLSVVFEWNDTEWNVVVYDDLERIDSEGFLAEWVEGQVRQFLLQLMNYDFQVLQARQFELRNDPLGLNSSDLFLKIS
jgi:hypothetical protein